MKKLILFAFFLLLFSIDLFAQNRTEDFEITMPNQKVENSLYNSIEFIDSRYDTTFMGIVQLGAFNRKTKVVSEMPMPQQMDNVLASMIDASAKDGALLFQLRQLNFAEVTGATSERGYFYLRANLYVKEAERYQKLNSIDTIIFIKSIDVTRPLFKKGSRAITSFIARSLPQPPADLDSYSLDELTHIDSIEKRKIKVYNATAYADGLYLTYQSFMDQVPDKPVLVEKKDDKIVSVSTENEKGKKIIVKAKDAYAVIIDGKPFIATDVGFYQIRKIEDDFKFIGKSRVAAKTGDVIAAGVFFGVLGGLIATDSQATFLMKIDHVNGGLIRVKEIRAK